MSNYKVGIDPGWSNLGLAVLDKDDKVVLHINMKPSSHGNIAGATQAVKDKLAPFIGKIDSVAVEKYVVYGRGVPSKAAIDTTMMVGALCYMFHTIGLEAQLYKAIDWKKAVCKDLFKNKGFKNPSSSFDKKYSMAAATCICGIKFPTDHEADAACLAFLSGVKT